MTMYEIYEALYMLPEFNLKSQKPELSYPVIAYNGDRAHVVFMVHYFNEPIPDGFASYDLETGTCSYYKNKDAAEFFGLQIKEAIEISTSTPRSDGKLFSDYMEYFNAIIAENSLDKNIYNRYLTNIISYVPAKEQAFYAMFRL